MGMKYRFDVETAKGDENQSHIVDLNTVAQMCNTLEKGFSVIALLEAMGRKVTTENRITKVVIEEVND